MEGKRSLNHIRGCTDLSPMLLDFEAGLKIKGK